MQLDELTDKSKAGILHWLDTGEQGLSSKEAAHRLHRYGANKIAFHRSKSPLRMLVEEFTALFPLLLMASSLLSH